MATKLRIAVIGSRGFKDFDFFSKVLDCYVEETRCLISGGAIGADQFAESYAFEHGLTIVIMFPKWNLPNGEKDKSAGIKRNKKIIDAADLVLAFWDGKSPGTKMGINYSKEKKKDLMVFTPPYERF